MNRKKHSIILTKVRESNQAYEYLGSDGLPIEDTYALYLKRCSEFIAKAKKYKRDNMNLKTSLLHHDHYGFENSADLEERILMERKEQMADYAKVFDVTNFNESQKCMYENGKGRSKRIRLIRELGEPRPSDKFSDTFDKETKSWFTRYCNLSKFVQAARTVIIVNRLKRKLRALRVLTPETVAQFELNEDGAGDDVEVARGPTILPCNYCPEPSV